MSPTFIPAARERVNVHTVARDAEAKFVNFMATIRGEAASWKGVHFRFSKLLEHYRSDYQIKIAVNMITDLLKSQQATLFMMADGDICIAAKGASDALLEKLVFQLRYLFMDDPLAYTPDGLENEVFCAVYDLARAWDAFLEVGKRKLGKSAQVEIQEAMARSVGSNELAIARIRPLTASRLSSIESGLAGADLSRVIRRQPICASPPGKPVKRVFDELYINIAHLRQLLMADVDLHSNRALFSYLTQILDQRMLDLIMRYPNRYFDKPMSLNLNVETLLSDQFGEFDASLKPAIKVSIVLELQLADIFSNMGAFLAARNSVQKLGYRVCLDGLTNLSFLQVNREGLGFDLAKLQWNADLDLTSPEYQKLKAAVQECGPSRIILCRCDSRLAIEYGQALGISLFQGRYLDRIVMPESKIEN